MNDLTVGDFAEVFDLVNLTSLNNTEDLIGAMLRVHFAIETVLKIWCSKIAKCEDFFKFDKDVYVPFLLKLEISKKLGLPTELADVFQKLNTIRNNLAHMKITTISDKELDEICDEVDKIPLGNSKNSYAEWNMRDIVINEEDYPVWNIPNISTAQKLFTIFLGIMPKVMIIFRDEFEERGIKRLDNY